MADSPADHKTSQQNLLNYISHNLGRKTDNEKEELDNKNSSTKGAKADKASVTSATSGP